MQREYLINRLNQLLEESKKEGIDDDFNATYLDSALSLTQKDFNGLALIQDAIREFEK